MARIETVLLWSYPAGAEGVAFADCQLPDGSTARCLVRQRDAEPWRTYRPLFTTEEIALYRELARTPATEEGILGFVLQYGPLGEGVEVEVPTEGATVFLEPLVAWKRAIAWAAELTRVWDLARADDRAGLAEYIHLDDRTGAVSWCWPVRLRSALELNTYPSKGWPDPFGADALRNLSATEPGHVGLYFPPGEEAMTARAALAGLLNVFLDGTTSVRMAWDMKQGRPVEVGDACSLFAALWLQLARAVEHDKEPRACEVCGRWFEVAPGSGRADKVVCSAACRSRAYRARRERAQALYAEGKTPAAIARELGSDVETVKGWVKGLKRGK